MLWSFHFQSCAPWTAFVLGSWLQYLLNLIHTPQPIATLTLHHLHTFPLCSLTCPEGTQFTHPSRTQGKPSVYHLRATRTSSHLKSQSSAFRSLNPQPSALYYALGCKPPPHNESQVRRVERRLNSEARSQRECGQRTDIRRQKPEVRSGK